MQYSTSSEPVQPDPRFGMFQVGTVIALSEGFLLQYRDKSYACKDARALGRRLTQLALTPPEPVYQSHQPSMLHEVRFTDPVPDPLARFDLGPPSEFEDARFAGTDPLAGPFPPETEGPVQPELVQANLAALAEGFVTHQLSQEQFMALLPRSCPGVTGDEIDAALNKAELAAFGPVAPPEGAPAPTPLHEALDVAEELPDEAIPFVPVTRPVDLVPVDPDCCTCPGCTQTHAPDAVECDECSHDMHMHKIPKVS